MIFLKRIYTNVRSQWQTLRVRFFLRLKSMKVSQKPEALQGFTLLIAVVLSSVLISVGLALLDTSYKQVLLASAATQSQYAFYNADSALECALYWDQQQNAFDYTAPLTSIICNGQTMTLASAPNSTTVSAGVRTTQITVPCAGSGSNAAITVSKGNNAATAIYTSGYNSCLTADPRRTERGLKLTYGTP